MPMKSSALFSIFFSFFENLGKFGPIIFRISSGYSPNIIGSKILLRINTTIIIFCWKFVKSNCFMIVSWIRLTSWGRKTELFQQLTCLMVNCWSVRTIWHSEQSQYYLFVFPACLTKLGYTVFNLNQELIIKPDQPWPDIFRPDQMFYYDTSLQNDSDQIRLDQFLREYTGS